METKKDLLAVAIISVVDKLEDACASVMPWPISAEGDAADFNPSPTKKQSILWSSYDSQMRNEECVTWKILTSSEFEVGCMKVKPS